MNEKQVGKWLFSIDWSVRKLEKHATENSENFKPDQIQREKKGMQCSAVHNRFNRPNRLDNIY